MEKRLIHFDEAGFKSHNSKLNAIVGQVNTTIRKINQINGFRMSAPYQHDLFEGTGEAIATAIQRANEADLDRAGIQSQSVRKAAIQADLEAYYTLFNAFQQPGEYSQDLVIDESGLASVKPGLEESLRERYSVYIRTERGQAIYDAQHKVVEAMNELLGLTDQLSNMSLVSICAPVFGERKVMPTLLRYDSL